MNLFLRCFLSVAFGLGLAYDSNAQYTFDPSFSGDGVWTSGASGVDSGKSLVLHQGKTYIAGTCPATRSPFIVLACVQRLLADGSPDPSFNGGVVTNTSGRVGYSMGDTDTDVSSIVVSPNGKITVSGRCISSSVASACLNRMNADGSLDTAFGSGGRVVLSSTAGNNSLPLLAESDGAVLLGSTVQYNDPNVGLTLDFHLRRISNAGVASGFGGTNLPGNSLILRALAKQADGAVVAAGQCTSLFLPSSRSDFCSARFLANGTLDSSYGATSAGPSISDGTVWSSDTPLIPVQTVYSATMLVDNSLVIAGRCLDGSEYKACAVAVNPLAQASTKVQWYRWVQQSILTATHNANTPVRLAALPDGKFLAAGGGRTCGSVGCGFGSPFDATFVSRLLVGGDFDLSMFSAGGFPTHVATPASLADAGIAVQPDRKFVIAGGDAAVDFYAARFNQTGAFYKACSADVDGDGAHIATIDGLLWSRAMLGMTGSSMVNGITFPTGATRTSWSAIRDYLANECGMSLAP
jgi:uncharacterized delta-60 repeat protein